MKGIRWIWSTKTRSSSDCRSACTPTTRSSATEINSALYVASSSGNLNTPGELSFDYSSGGVTVRKSFAFGDTYVISIETSVTKDGKLRSALPVWPAALRR